MSHCGYWTVGFVGYLIVFDSTALHVFFVVTSDGCVSRRSIFLFLRKAKIRHKSLTSNSRASEHSRHQFIKSFCFFQKTMQMLKNLNGESYDVPVTYAICCFLFFSIIITNPIWRERHQTDSVVCPVLPNLTIHNTKILLVHLAN